MQIDNREKPILPSTMFKTCPIRTSLGVLGKKRTLLILRDLGFLKIQRFNQIRRSLPGLTPRVLTIRLRELEESGFIKPVVVQRSPRIVRWELTEMGTDTVPILMTFISFGSKWYPDVVFEDGEARTSRQLFPTIPTIQLRKP
jgi:DNA-binding HxlR family transcriptional regulator